MTEVEPRRSGRARRSMATSLNESVLQADVLEGERDMIRRSRESVQEEREGRQREDAEDEDEATKDGEEEHEDDDDEEEEEADDTEKRARKPRKAAKGRGKAARASSSSPSSLSTPARPRASSSSSRTPSSRRVLDERPTEEEKEFTSLWHDVARSSESIKSIVRTFLASYEAATKGAEKLKLQAELLSFLIEAAGGVGGLTASEVRSVSEESDVEELLARYEEADMMVQAEAPVRRIKKFEGRLRELFQRLYGDSWVALLVEDRFFRKVLPSFVAVFSRSVVRAYRLTMSLAFSGMMGGICGQAVEIEKQRDTADKQHTAGHSKKHKPSAALLSALESSLTELSNALSALHALLHDLYTSVFSHRYRDVDEHIRALHLSSLASWMVAYPNYFLSPSTRGSFLKHLGWMLNDKAASVRKAVLSGLLLIYRHATEAMLETLKLFTRHFISRLEQMCEDVDDGVSALAIEFLVVMHRSEQLNKDEGSHIRVLLWDESPAVRKAAVHFVVADTFARSERAEEGKEGGSIDDDLVQVALLFHSYCPLVQATSRDKAAAEEGGHEHPVPVLRRVVLHDGQLHALRALDYQRSMDVLVEGLFPHVPALHDWQALQQLIKKGEEERGKQRKRKGKANQAEEQQLRLAAFYSPHVLLASARRVVEAAAQDKKDTKKDDQDKRDEAAAALSLFLIEQLPSLLSTFLWSSRHLSLFLPLLSCIRFDQFHHHRKHAAFTSLLAALKKIVTSSVDWPVLRECGLAWRRLLKDNESFKEEAEHVVDQVALEWKEAVRQLWEQGEGGGSQDGGHTAEDLLGDDERAHSLLALLKRILALTRQLHVAELAYSSPALHRLFHQLLPTLADGAHHETPVQQELLLCLLQLLYTDAVWRMSGLDRSSPARAGLERLVVERNDLCSVLHRLLEHSESFAVKDAAYEMCGDVFVLFSAKHQGGVLHDLALNRERLAPLSAAFADYFLQLMDGHDAEQRWDEQQTLDEAAGEVQQAAEDREARVSSHLADLRVQALVTASHVICFDQDVRAGAPAALAASSNPRHPQLTAYFLSRYQDDADTESLAILKQSMHLLRDLSFRALLHAQRVALVYAYEQHTEPDQVRALATKFALVHAVSHPSFLPLLRPAIGFAVHEPPSHLLFLDCLLPFVQRCSQMDAADLQEYWTQLKPQILEHRGEHRTMRSEEKEQWAALERFEDALAKRVGKAKASAVRRMERVTEEAREPMEEGEEEGAAEPSLLLTPAAAAASSRTPRSAGSERSGRSLLSLGLSPVKEALDEEDRNHVGSKRPRNTQKQQQQQRAGEDEQEQEQDGGREADEDDEEAERAAPRKKVKSDAAGRPRKAAQRRGRAKR